MKMDCDVLVVGGGPAGSSAARAASKNGLKTILIDKKEEIGKPVQCAEGVGQYLLSFLPFKIPKKQLIWQMDGIYFQTDTLSIEKTGGHWKSYSIDRTKFDKWLSNLAVKNGTKIYTDAKLTSIETEEKYNIKKAFIKKKEKTIEIKPKTVIAADGVDSTILKLLGLYHPNEGDLADVYSWEMNNLNLYKPEFEQIFTGDFTPSGYAYIFPKSKKAANIGVGGIYPKRKIEHYFEEFIEIPHVKQQIKNANYEVEKSKKAVFNNLTDKWIYGNVILAGDTANQNLKPFIEGILPSIVCGDIAGEISSKLCNNKIITDEMYKHISNEKLGGSLNFSDEILKLINYLFKREKKTKYLQFFGLITNIITEENFNDFEIDNYDTLKMNILRMIDEV